jgi:hypothetical protein
MMAAVRILIWLPVREVRRSSNSNMAFPLGACSFFWAGVAPSQPLEPESYPADAANGKPIRTRSCCAGFTADRLA